MKIEHSFVLYHDKPNSIKYMEECVESCKEYNMPITPFKGFGIDEVSAQKILKKWGLRIDPRLDEIKNTETGRLLYQEILCSSGHVAIWKEIATRDAPCAVFEHDSIVVRDFRDIEVNDRDIVFLGYRMAERQDYKCVQDSYDLLPINMFGGTHAYAIAPWTAKRMVEIINDMDYVPLEKSVDWWLGHNYFSLNMLVADPVPVISVICNRENTINHMFGNVANYNMPAIGGMPPKYLKGIVNKEKYFYNQNNWLCFKPY